MSGAAPGGWQPRPATLATIDAARAVLDEAEAAGYRFTLRRVFYALVSAGTIPNTERAYKRLSATLDRARWEGLLPLDCLDDLARLAAVVPSWQSPAEMMRAAAEQYRSDWWSGADPYVEVWAEKAAVAGIVEPVARRWGVPFLACRGFASLTAVAEAVARFDGRRTVVLYVGDHDPSGLDMDRDLAGRMQRLGADVELVRLALTVAQIDAHQLPPQPTKGADSRAFGYSRDHAGSWELDALPADDLAGLVSDAIATRQPPDMDARQAADDTARARIVEVAGLVR